MRHHFTLTSTPINRSRQFTSNCIYRNYSLNSLQFQRKISSVFVLSSDTGVRCTAQDLKVTFPFQTDTFPSVHPTVNFSPVVSPTLSYSNRMDCHDPTSLVRCNTVCHSGPLPNFSFMILHPFSVRCSLAAHIPPHHSPSGRLSIRSSTGLTTMSFLFCVYRGKYLSFCLLQLKPTIGANEIFILFACYLR